MTIEVLFFAQLKEAMGCAKRSVDVEDGATVDGLVAMITAWPEWKPVCHLPLVIAVNERVTDTNQRLKDGDTVALIPPVSGG